MHAGGFVEISGVGKRYSGTFRMSKVTHTINDSGYRTTFEISPTRTSSFVESLRTAIQDKPPPNKQQKFYAPMIGKVESNYDLLHPGQVQVTLPELSDDNRSAWARVVSPMATGDAGTYFLPDVGDEVLVVFENGDINKPRVLGGSWNGQGRPPTDAVSPQNSVKLIRTKAGHAILLDDAPGQEKVSIFHSSGSRIDMGNDGSITLEAKGDLNLKAANVNLEAEGDLNFNAADANVKVKGKMDVSKAN
jgi:uncharacterized protein involved in type VI secretion and phage assembly